MGVTMNEYAYFDEPIDRLLAAAVERLFNCDGGYDSDDYYDDNDDDNNNEWDWDWDDYGYVWRRVLIPFDDDMHPTRFSWRWFWRSWGWHYINGYDNNWWNDNDDDFYGPPSDDEYRYPPTPAPQTPQTPAPQTPPAPRTPSPVHRPAPVIIAQLATMGSPSMLVEGGILVRRAHPFSRYAPRNVRRRLE
jgi:hypothetical protein